MLGSVKTWAKQWKPKAPKKTQTETNTKSKGQEKEQLNSQSIDDHEEKLETHKDGERKGLPRMLGHRREQRRKLKAGAIVGKDVQG